MDARPSQVEAGRMNLRPLLVLASACLLVSTSAAPAYAEQLGLDDGADAAPSLGDIYSVSAKHSQTRVVIKAVVADLRPESEAGPSQMSFFVDTDPAAKGPEFRLATGMQEGTDFQLRRVENWKAVGPNLTCNHKVRLNFVKDRVKAQVSRPCLGDPAKVRIGVKMTDLFDGSHPVVDWLGQRRYLSQKLTAD
jgi:hypothetical protein